MCFSPIYDNILLVSIFHIGYDTSGVHNLGKFWEISGGIYYVYFLKIVELYCKYYYILICIKIMRSDF
jgi:hypothetical protein